MRRMGYKNSWMRTTVLLASLLILIPLIISYVPSSSSTYVDDVRLSNITVELAEDQASYFGCSAIIPGQWYYVNFTLDKSYPRVSLIACHCNNADSLSKNDHINHYQWDYEGGKWEELGNNPSKYILSSKCSKQGARYSFHIRIDPTVKTGNWTIKVFAGDKEVCEAVFSVENAKTYFLLSALCTTTSNKEKLFSLSKWLRKHEKKPSNLISEEKSLNCGKEGRSVNKKASAADIEWFIDHSLGTRSSVSQIKNLAGPVKKTSFYDELVDKLIKDHPSAQETDEDEEIGNCYEVEKTIVVDSSLKVSTKKGVIPPPLRKACHLSVFSGGGGVAFLIVFLLISLAFIPVITSFDDSIDSNSPVISGFTLSPDRVVNGDTMFLNVSIYNNVSIPAVTVDMGGIETMQLSLIDNSTSDHLWQAVWTVHDVEVGEYVTTITAIDEENASYRSEVRWSVLPEETPDDNQSSETGTNETSAEGNESFNETTPPIDIDDGNMTGNETIISTGLNLSLQSDKDVYFVNETVVIRGTITYNDTLIDTSVNLLIEGPAYNSSETVNTTNGLFFYQFIPTIDGNYLVNSSAFYTNESAFAELGFVVNKEEPEEPDDPIINDTEEIVISDNVEITPIQHEKVDTTAVPFFVYEAPEDSFGIQPMKFVNWSYFWQLFTQHSAWQMEGWNPQTEEWVTEYQGINLNEWLNISKIRSEDNSSEKITLNFTSPFTTRYRFTFGIDAHVKEYVNRSGQYEYELTYPANLTENYTVYFNWSDVMPMVENGTISLRHGIKNVSGIDIFWFRIIGNQNLQAGHSFEIDPTFGYETGGGTTATIEDTIRGSKFTMGAIGGTAANISAYLEAGPGAENNVKFAIYDTSNNLVGYTEQAQGSDGWNTLNITSGGSLSANTDYYLVAWAESTAETMEICYDDLGSQNGYYDSEVYDGFPNPWNPTNKVGDLTYSIYCSYTQGSPIISGEYPTNGSTGISIRPICNVTVLDPQNDTMTVYFYENTTGSWVLQQTKGSVSSGSNVIWDSYSNASSGSTMYWWSVNATDGTYWTNKTYYFTTESSGMGWELLDNNKVLHIWNRYNDYYFNTSRIQLTNHYNEYWSHNVLMLGYYAGDEWNLIYRTDELSGFDRGIDTDNETYINATLWKDLTYGDYDFKLAIRYHLKVDDYDLTIIPYIKNLGIAIPYTLSFGWELKDIKIDNTYENDWIQINETSYLLNQTLDIKYTNITKTVYEYNKTTNTTTNYTVKNGAFYLQNRRNNLVNRDLYLKWNPELDYLVWVKSRDGQYNAPVTVFIKVGMLNVCQEKFTKMHWLDSTGATFGYETEGGSGLYIGKVTIDPFTGRVGMGSCRRGTTYSPLSSGTLSEMHAFIQCPGSGGGKFPFSGGRPRPPSISDPRLGTPFPFELPGTIPGTVVFSYKLTLAIFEEDGWGANSHKLIEKHTTTWIDTSGWVDITGFSQSINANTNYILAACAEVSYPVYEPVTINLGYDDVGTNRYYEEPVLSSGFPDREPWNLAEAGTGRKYSIYCTYTPSNNAPTQSGEIPANTSTGISVTPQLYVLCKDNDADNMNATWWSNSSGSWVQFASNWTSFANNTNITQPFTNASAYGTTYYWSLNLTDGIDWTNETYHFTTSYAPVINSYDLLNSAGSKLNSITGLLDVNNEYYFQINITDANGWDDIQYINITAWYDNGSESTTYNQSNNTGGNLNMKLQYENTTGTANYTMLWPDDEATLITVNCTGAQINSTTHVVNISFKPLWQVRHSPCNGGWNTTPGFNDINSWNLKINVTDQGGESDTATSEYGVYRYTSVDPIGNWVGVYAITPGNSTDTNTISVNHTSNYDFNMTIWFTENLTNESSGKVIPVANNVKILKDADPNDDINDTTGNITFTGTGEENKVDIFNASGTFAANGAYRSVSVRFNVKIPFGTPGGVYKAIVGVETLQET